MNYLDILLDKNEQMELQNERKKFYTIEKELNDRRQFIETLQSESVKRLASNALFDMKGVINPERENDRQLMIYRLRWTDKEPYADKYLSEWFNESEVF